MIRFTAPDDRIVRPGKQVTDKVTEKVTDSETAILALLTEDPSYTTMKMAQQLSVSRKTISARIKVLKDKGIIRRVGSDRKGHWEIVEKDLR